MRGYNYWVTTKILEVVNENEKIRSYRLEKPEGFLFMPGQYFTVKLNDSLEHDLTISASPTERFLQFTTMYHADSEFKKHLWNLQIGSSIEITEPKGEFVLDEIDIRERVFLAGGIGITPFRSMLKHATDKQLHLNITLLLSVKTAEEAVLVKDLKAQIIETSKQGRIDAEKIKKYCLNWQESTFWICGPPGFVDAMIKLTAQMGLSKEQVRSEDFPGY